LAEKETFMAFFKSDLQLLAAVCDCQELVLAGMHIFEAGMSLRGLSCFFARSVGITAGFRSGLHTIFSQGVWTQKVGDIEL
jgi:ABC-type proline/glycine betaine transport system permease subunit